MHHLNGMHHPAIEASTIRRSDVRRSRYTIFRAPLRVALFVVVHVFGTTRHTTRLRLQQRVVLYHDICTNATYKIHAAIEQYKTRLILESESFGC